MDPRLLGLYEGELSYLREMGEEFSRAYPKVAARLDLGSLDVADPYIERLLEGCAFLTARIQLKMEQEFPTFTESLLQVVYPHYFAPTPSMAIVQFRPDPAIRTLPRGVTLPRGTELRSLLGTEDQTNCEFRTGHAVRLLPIEIAEAEYIPTPAAVGALQLPEQRGVRAALRVRLRSLGDVPLAELDLSALPLFLSGPQGLRMRLYEQLAADLLAVMVRPPVSTATGCSRNISHFPSASCSSSSAAWRARPRAAPARRWTWCCCSGAATLRWPPASRPTTWPCSRRPR